jgi:hypothetical protein
MRKRKMDEIHLLFLCYKKVRRWLNHLLFYLFHKYFVEKPISEELGPRNENYGL